MSLSPAVQEHISTELARFSPADTEIERLVEEFGGLTIAGVEDREGFKRVHNAQMIFRGHRVAVEKLRKDLKADSLAFGRAVDAEAKRITALMEPTEMALKAEKDRIEAIKAELEQRAIREREQRLEARMERLRAVNSARLPHQVAELEEFAFEAALAQDTEAYEAAQEQARKEAEAKAAEEAQRKAEQEAEDQRLRKEREELDAERAKQAAKDAEDRRAREEAEAKLRKEREAFEAEKRQAAEAKAEEERKARESAEAKARAERLEALRPEIEKVEAYAESLMRVPVPGVSCEDDIYEVTKVACAQILRIAKGLGVVA